MARYRARRGYGVEALQYDQREVVLRVNFEDLDHDGCFDVSMRFLGGPRHPMVGEAVYLLDGDGHGCMGEVVAVNGWSARVRPASRPQAS
jgi:hypothetical protein